MPSSTNRTAHMKEICNAIEAGSLNALLQTEPHLLQQSDSLGDLPLHAACSARYQSTPNLHSISTIQTLARHYPEALSTPNAHGMLPLHLACWFTDPTLIRSLVDLHPQALSAADENGYTPVSFVIGKLVMSNEGWSVEMCDLLEYLLERAPDSLWQVDPQGILPFQYACLSTTGVGHQILQLYLKVTAAEGGLKRMVSSNASAHKQTPIHIAIASNTRLDILRHLHQADPQAIHISDGQGQVALHPFLSKDYVHHHKVYWQTKLKWYLEQDPQAVLRQDVNGKTPLHLLLENDSLLFQHDDPIPTTSTTPPALSFLANLLAPRRGTRQPDRNDWIQYAAEQVCSACPQVCAIADRDGNLPLHIALQRHSRPGCASGLIPTILQHYPQAVLVPNRQGLKALEIAARGGGCSLTTLYTLVNHNPCRVLQDYMSTQEEDE